MKKNNMKKYILAISIMVFILVVLTVIQSVVANSVSTVGVDIAVIQEEIDAYKKDNALLKETYLTRSSYTIIAEEVEERGFEPSTKQLSLTSPQPLAYR